MVPTLAPFNFHWKEGAPPFTGVAVNVTLVPEQIVDALAAIVTVGATVPLTVIVIAFDVAVGCVTQVSVDVITTVTTSLLARVAFW